MSLKLKRRRKPGNSFFFSLRRARAPFTFHRSGSHRGAREIVVKVVQRCDKERNPMRVSDKWLMPLVWGTAMFQPWVKTLSRGVAVTPSLRPFDRVKPPGSTTQIELCQGDEKSFAN